MSFDPSQLSNLAVWLRADAGAYKDSALTTAATADGDVFAGWADQSGGSNNFTQATTANQGVYKTSRFGSNPALRTNGSTGSGSAQYLQLANASASTAAKGAESGSHTWFFLLNPIAFATTYQCWFNKANLGDTRLDFLAVNDTTGRRFQRYNGIYAAPLAGGKKSLANTATPYVLCHTFDSAANTESWWVNGALITQRSAAYPASNSTSPFTLGTSADFTASLNADYGQVGAYNRVLSYGEISQVSSYLATWGSSSLTSYDNTVRFVFVGDSITAGDHTTGDDNGWAYQTLGLLGKSYGCVNWGISGGTLATFVSERAIKGLASRVPATRTVLFLFAGTNDIASGTTAATCETNLQTYANDAKPAGFKVVLFCILPRTTLTGPQETERQTFNTWLRANWATYGDALVDYATDGSGRLNDASNTTYFADGIHPNDAGAAVLAAIVQTAVNTLSLPATGFTVSGGSSSLTVGSATSAFTVAIPSGETFSGAETIILTVTDGTVAVTGGTTSVTSNVTTVTPTAGNSSFTFTYTPATAGTKAIAYGNGQGWANPANSSVTANPAVTLSASPSTIERGVPTTVTITYTGGTPAAGTPITANHGTVGSETVGSSTVAFLFTDSTSETVIFTDTASGATCTASVTDTTAPGIPAPGAGTITAAYSFTLSWSAIAASPSGETITYDVKKNGTTVSSAQAGTTYAVTSAAAGDVFGVDARDNAGNVSSLGTYTVPTPSTGSGRTGILNGGGL